MSRSWLVFLISITCCLAAAGQQPDRSFRYRWSGYGYFTSAASFGEMRQTFMGGGGGAEAFLWKGLAAGAEVSAYRENRPYAGLWNFGHTGFNASYHFASREKRRGFDPFLVAGVGSFFPDEPQLVVHGGGGFTYWFARHAGIRTEFRVSERQPGDDVVGMFRIGIALR